MERSRESIFLSAVTVFLLLVAHLIASQDSMIETCVIIMAGIIGAGVECINIVAGVYQYTYTAYEPALLPTWIIMAWFLPGNTTRQIFSYLSRQIATLSIAGAVTGTTFYYVAANMGAIVFTSSTTPFSVIPILLWSLTFPLIIYIGNQFFRNN